MPKIEVGDIVFSYAKQKLLAISVATGTASTSPKPEDFGRAGDVWANVGWHVPVDFAPLSNPLSVKESFEFVKEAAQYKHSPLDKNGDGAQKYLSPITTELANKLIFLLGSDYDQTLALAGGSMLEVELRDNAEQQELENRTDIGGVEINQLVKARRGQGIYKSNLKNIEKFCRVTKLEIPQHLVASHIKPWSLSNDFEKLDGNNGLLLSPHVDHLFDRGYISFTNRGQLLTSNELQQRVLSAWHINRDANVGDFNKEQCKYLEFHRDVILKSAS